MRFTTPFVFSHAFQSFRLMKAQPSLPSRCCRTGRNVRVGFLSVRRGVNDDCPIRVPRPSVVIAHVSRNLSCDLWLKSGDVHARVAALAALARTPTVSPDLKPVALHTATGACSLEVGIKSHWAVVRHKLRYRWSVLHFILQSKLVWPCPFGNVCSKMRKAEGSLLPPSKTCAFHATATKRKPARGAHPPPTFPTRRWTSLPD